VAGEPLSSLSRRVAKSQPYVDDQALYEGEVVASFSVPYRPKLFGKVKPMVLNLGPVALERDEVFLFLVFVYCESKRQDKMVCLVPPSL
jgi:hypothetical protein